MSQRSNNYSEPVKTPNSKNPVNLGLIGLGKWARQAYVPILQELPEVNVVAVSARTEATMQLAKDTFGSSIALYTDYHDLLSDPNVQAVFIALPNKLHAQAVEAASLADKHIFFEPPIGLDKEQIERVLKLIGNSERVVQTNLELRYLPVIDTVRELIDSGKIGKVVTAKIRLWCNWRHGGGDLDKTIEEQGFFLWLSSWYLDVLDVIFAAPPTNVHIKGGYAMNGRLMDHGLVTMSYPNEASGQFEFSLIAVEGEEVTLHVAGTCGEIEANLQTGSCQWRQKHKPWQQLNSPASQPVHGFVGMRESITDFFNAIKNNRPAKADSHVCRRVHHAVTACIDAETRNLHSE